MSGTGSGDTAKGLAVVFVLAGVCMLAIYWVESGRARVMSQPQRTVSMKELAAMKSSDKDRNLKVVEYEFLPSYSIETKNGRWEEVVLALVPEGSEPVGAKADVVVSLKSARSQADVDRFVMQGKVAGIRSADRTTNAKVFANLRNLNPGLQLTKAWVIDADGVIPSEGFLISMLVGGAVSFGLALVCVLVWLGVLGGGRAAGAAPPRQALFDDAPPPGMKA